MFLRHLDLVFTRAEEPRFRKSEFVRIGGRGNVLVVLAVGTPVNSSWPSAEDGIVFRRGGYALHQLKDALHAALCQSASDIRRLPGRIGLPHVHPQNTALVRSAIPLHPPQAQLPPTTALPILGK